MARNDQMNRVLKVISLLERNLSGLSVREIHSRLEGEGIVCSLRSVYRDLEAIQQAYFPVIREGNGDESRWRMDSVARVTPSIQISYRELMALFIARHSLEAMKGSPIYDAIVGLFEKMEKVLGPKAQEGLAEFESYLGCKSRPAWQSGVSQEVMDTVHQACAEGHVLEIEYKAVSGENQGVVKARKVGPSAIYLVDSGAYLIAKDLASGVFKTYSLGRIKSAVLLDEAFDGHGSFPKEFLQGGIGVLTQGEVTDVEIEIAEPLASYVSERRWHGSQTVARTESGVRLRMRVRVNDELVRWVLGLGADAVVLRPESLRERVGRAAGQIAAKCKSGKAS